MSIIAKLVNQHRYGFGSEIIGTDYGRESVASRKVTWMPNGADELIDESSAPSVLAPSALTVTQLYWPFDYRTLYITQHFSNANGGHKGLDIGIPVNTKLYSPLPIRAQIVWCGWNDQGYGNLIGLKASGFYVLLGHLSKVNPDLRVGNWVEPSAFIGWSGNTGNSTGPHLHLEVRQSNSGYFPYPSSCINPEPLMTWNSGGTTPPPPPPTPTPIPTGWYRAQAQQQLNLYSKQKLKFAVSWPKVADGAVISIKDKKTLGDIEWVILENGLFTPKRYRGTIYLKEI